MPSTGNNTATALAEDVGSARPRLVIAEDSVLIQEAMRLFLEPRFHVVAVADEGQTALRMVDQHQPDILLVDVSLPLVSGFDVAAKLRDLQSTTKVIFVSGYANRDYVEKAFALGACGYVLKGAAHTELPGAIAAVMSGVEYRSPSLA